MFATPLSVLEASSFVSSVSQTDDQTEKAISALSDALEQLLAEKVDRESDAILNHVFRGRDADNLEYGEDEVEDAVMDEAEEEENDRSTPGTEDTGVSAEGSNAIGDGEEVIGNDNLVDDHERTEKEKIVVDKRIRTQARDAVRDALFSDPYILATAEAYSIPEEDMLTRNKNNQLVFILKAEYFENWRARHQVCIGANFTPHGKPRPYSTNISKSSSQGKKDRAGQIVHRFDCHCKGANNRVKGRQLGGKTGKTRVRAASIKCSCKSFFNAIYRPFPTSDFAFPSTYVVEYSFEHSHKLGDKDNVGIIQKSKAIRQRINAMIWKGMSIQAIMDELTIDHARLTRFMERGEKLRLSEDDCVTYDDVYNILYAINAKQMRKESDATISTRLWMEDLEGQGYFTYYDRTRGLYQGFSSPWQLDELRKWGGVLCFDVSHHTCRKDTYLFTLVVKNRETGYGVPVAFLLTTNQQPQALEGWLRALKAKMDILCDKEYKPTAVITDQGQNEIDAIRAVFAYDIRILFCPWRVLQVWEEHFTNEMLGLKESDTPELKQSRKGQICAGLRKIVYAKTEGEADMQIVAFKRDWDIIAKEFVACLECGYLESEALRRPWMFCYRQGVSYAGFNTNNYIEGWHTILKKHLPKDGEQQRLDTLLYTLVHQCVPYFQLLSIRQTVKVDRMTTEQKAVMIARKNAMDYLEERRVQDPEAVVLLPSGNDTVFRVLSFADATTCYDVGVTWDERLLGWVNSCTCASFSSNQTICEHMALLTMELPSIVFRYSGDEGTKENAVSSEVPLLLDQAQDDHSVESLVSVTTTPGRMLEATRYLQGLSDMLYIMDKEGIITNEEEVLTALKNAFDLCTAHIPIQSAHEQSRKRARPQD